MARASVAIRGAEGEALAGAWSDEDEDAREVVLPSGGADYLLHVTGDSMTRAGIREGDMVYVRSQQAAREGDIVVAYMAGEGEVVKRFREAAPGTPALLLSEIPDPTHQHIPLDEGSCIQGKVVSLLRDHA